MTANLAPAAGGKSPEAFRTISEAAEELNVPQHVLRFWESRFSQIRPLKRAGGRRFYRPEDVELLRGIRALLYDEGYTIKGAQKVLRERGVRHVAGIGRSDAEAFSPGPRTPPSADDPGTSHTMAMVDAAFASEADDEAPGGTLDGEQRERLKEILQELLDLKERLRTH